MKSFVQWYVFYNFNGEKVRRKEILYSILLHNKHPINSSSNSKYFFISIHLSFIQIFVFPKSLLKALKSRARNIKILLPNWHEGTWNITGTLKRSYCSEITSLVTCFSGSEILYNSCMMTWYRESINYPIQQAKEYKCEKTKGSSNRIIS